MKANKQCPHCGGYKTNSSRDAWKKLLLLGLATSWIFGLGLIFLIAVIPAYFVGRVGTEKFVCLDCRYKFVA